MNEIQQAKDRRRFGKAKEIWMAAERSARAQRRALGLPEFPGTDINTRALVMELKRVDPKKS